MPMLMARNHHCLAAQVPLVVGHKIITCCNVHALFIQANAQVTNPSARMILTPEECVHVYLELHCMLQN